MEVGKEGRRRVEVERESGRKCRERRREEGLEMKEGDRRRGAKRQGRVPFSSSAPANTPQQPAAVIIDAPLSLRFRFLGSAHGNQHYSLLLTTARYCSLLLATAHRTTDPAVDQTLLPTLAAASPRCAESNPASATAFHAAITPQFVHIHSLSPTPYPSPSFNLSGVCRFDSAIVRVCTRRMEGSDKVPVSLFLASGWK